MFFRYPQDFYANKSCPFTLNTTRICENTPINTSIELSRLGFESSKPNAVILVNENEIHNNIAAASLVHFPINAPILLTNGNSLNEETFQELLRLSPKGYRKIKVLLIGNISNNISDRIEKSGLSTYRINGTNHYQTACEICNFRANFKNILIMSGENYDEGISLPFWSAHMGDPILFVQKDNIPKCTLDKIRSIPKINIYIAGTENTVSRSVYSTISKLPNVNFLDRISGGNPYEIAVNFSRYKSPEGDFGWGRVDRNGHAFTFGTLSDSLEIIPAVLLAHMGKHTPLLLIEKSRIPQVVSKYIKEIKPLEMAQPYPPFMHGFILGCKNYISNNLQQSLDKLLSIEHHMSI